MKGLPLSNVTKTEIKAAQIACEAKRILETPAFRLIGKKKKSEINNKRSDVVFKE